MGYELAEQLGWRCPTSILYPTGGGTGLIGMWKAFDEMEALGWIGSNRPRMVAVQAVGAPDRAARLSGRGCSRLLGECRHHRLRHPRAAGGGRLHDPARGAREGNGFAIAVDDEADQRPNSKRSRVEDGFLMCPEGAATYAAWKQGLADGRIRRDERALLFNCATGLKYPLPPIRRTLDRHKPIDFASLSVENPPKECAFEGDGYGLAENGRGIGCSRGGVGGDRCNGPGACPRRLPQQAGAHHRQFRTGSSTDVALRVVAERLSRIWNQQVVALNNPGAGGSIAARAAASSPNDGYTLSFAAASTFTALAGAPGVPANLPIEVPRDFLPIGFVSQQPMFIAASPKSGITSVADLIAAAKKDPGGVSYATTGVGRITHLTMELLQMRAGIKLQMIPYAGGPSRRSAI